MGLFLFCLLLIYLFVSVALICFVLYLRKIVLSNICILYCLVPLNSILLFFYSLFVSICFLVVGGGFFRVF